MDAFSLKRQFQSMEASLEFQALPKVAKERRQPRVTYLLNVEAGPRGDVFTFACRPAERGRRAVQAVDVRPRERHLLLLVRLFEQEEEYRKMLGRKPHAHAWVWRTRRRTMRVFARGRVRHPDHKTLILQDWYEVLMSDERMDESMVFLD